MEQRQDVRHRKTATLGLSRRLTEMGLQVGCVGHGEAGAVHAPGAVSAPAARLLDDGDEGITNALQQLFEKDQRQAAARQTISRRRERHPGQARQGGAGRVAVEDLQQKNVDRSDRIEQAFPSVMTQVDADPTNRIRGQRLGHIGLELGDDLGDIEGHPWPPVGMGMVGTAILTGGPFLSNSKIHNAQKHGTLRLT